MARVLDCVYLFVAGDPGEANPSHAFLTYEVVDGQARKQNQSHAVDTPDFTKAMSTFMADEVALIKTAEGIS